MAFYETLKLEKGMYGVPGKSFTQVLEGFDASENYNGTPLSGLDAYQRQLKRFGIRVGGPGSDMVEKFFQSGDTAALFPEYVARAVKQGMEQDGLLPKLVATVTRVSGMDYRTITATPVEGALVETLEGAAMDATAITTKNSLVRLKKRGRVLTASYEALRGQRLDLFTVLLRQIGAMIARGQAKDAVAVLMNGDDGKTPAGVINAATAGTLAYEDLLSLWGALSPYRFSAALCSTASMKDLLSISELKDPNAGQNFQGSGKLVTPLGATLIHLPEGLADKTIVGFDSSCALEMVQADGGIVTDYDKLIDRQLERASISSTTGFARIFDNACKVLNYGNAS